MISVQDMKYFAEICKAGNLSRAAASLHVSQPTLTHSLKRLEDQVGQVLVERGRKGIKPTPAGQRLFKSCEPLLLQWELLPRVAKSEQEGLVGRVRLGCHVSVALYSLGKFLPKMLQEHPHLEFFLVHELSRSVTQAVINSELDLALVINPVAHPDLIIRPLATDEVRLFAAPKMNSELEEVLVFDPSLAQAQWLLKALDKKKIHFKRQIQSGSLEVVRDLTANGCGIGLLPARVAAGSKLVPWGPDIAYKDELCLIYKPAFRDTPMAQGITKAIQAAKI